MGENSEIVRFLWYFMVFRKRTYGWTWDIVDFFVKSIHCPLQGDSKKFPKFQIVWR